MLFASVKHLELAKVGQLPIGVKCTESEEKEAQQEGTAGDRTPAKREREPEMGENMRAQRGKSRSTEEGRRNAGEPGPKRGERPGKDFPAKEQNLVPDSGAALTWIAGG